MTDKGYLASLETQTNWLKACKYAIAFENKEGNENVIYCKEQDVNWYVDIWLPNKEYNLLAVSEINPAEIPTIAKANTDRLAKERYGFVYEGDIK
jgi:hypothetical protein